MPSSFKVFHLFVHINFFCVWTSNILFIFQYSYQFSAVDFESLLLIEKKNVPNIGNKLCFFFQERMGQLAGIILFFLIFLVLLYIIFICSRCTGYLSLPMSPDKYSQFVSRLPFMRHNYMVVQSQERDFLIDPSEIGQEEIVWAPLNYLFWFVNIFFDLSFVRINFYLVTARLIWNVNTRKSEWMIEFMILKFSNLTLGNLDFWEAVIFLWRQSVIIQILLSITALSFNISILFREWLKLTSSAP